MQTDTIAIVVAILGVGLALWRAIDSRYKILRQDIKETNSRIDSTAGALNSRIDSTAGALNSRIDSLRQELRTDIAALHSRIDALRQELRTDIAALHSRIDALYQALFSHKDPAA